MSNYNSEREARIRAEAPLNLAKAKELASEFGDVTYRSVIAKAQQLGVEYVKLAPRRRAQRDNVPTKADYLAAISQSLALPDREGDLTKAELESVLVNIA